MLLFLFYYSELFRFLVPTVQQVLTITDKDCFDERKKKKCMSCGGGGVGRGSGNKMSGRSTMASAVPFENKVYKVNLFVQLFEIGIVIRVCV